MCGIVGAFQPKAGEVCAASVLTAMRDRMVHRGPDGAGIWRESNGRAGMAHRRLSIIDLSQAASQPMSNYDETVVVVFNGEIYNHAELRRELEGLGKYRWKTDHSDTEVLLHAYEEWGLECVHRFYGMFAFALYDARSPEKPVLHLVRDRLGLKPLYFSRTGKGEWLFASEIRALMAHPDLSPEMDLTAFWHYLTFIVAPAPLTMFRGVFKLPAAHTMSIDHQGRAVSRRYWDSCPDPARMLSERDLSEEEAVAEVLRLLRLSIRRRMVSDVPFGVLLSGGVDSSLNVALMSELMERPVTTFTIGYEGLEEVNEFEFARRVSRRYRTEHHETRINHKQAQDFLPLLVRLQDEPIADNVCIPLYFLAELVRRSGTTVVQVGEGADEHFLGYWWCEHYRRKERETYDPARRQRSAWAALLARIRGDLSASAEDEEIRTRARAGQELFWGGAVCWWGRMREQLTPRPARFQQEVQCPAEGLLPEAHQRLDSHAIVKHYLEALPNGGAAFDVLRKIPYLEMKVRLPEHLLMRVDKLTMAHSIEARVPFLDHDLVDFATKLPATYKLREGVGKYLLKRAAEPYLDADMIYRRKQGFGAPMEQWFREGDFGQRCLAAFERSQIRKEGFLDNQYVEGLLRAQIGGAGGYSFHIWTILNAVLWHEVWIQGNLNCI